MEGLSPRRLAARSRAENKDGSQSCTGYVDDDVPFGIDTEKQKRGADLSGSSRPKLIFCSPTTDIGFTGAKDTAQPGRDDAKPGLQLSPICRKPTPYTPQNKHKPKIITLKKHTAYTYTSLIQRGQAGKLHHNMMTLKTFLNRWPRNKQTV